MPDFRSQTKAELKVRVIELEALVQELQDKPVRIRVKCSTCNAWIVAGKPERKVDDTPAGS